MYHRLYNYIGFPSRASRFKFLSYRICRTSTTSSCVPPPRGYYAPLIPGALLRSIGRLTAFLSHGAAKPRPCSPESRHSGPGGPILLSHLASASRVTSTVRIRSRCPSSSSTYAFGLVLTSTSLLMLRTTATVHMRELPRATDLRLVSANLLPHLMLLNITSLSCSLPPFPLHSVSISRLFP